MKRVQRAASVTGAPILVAVCALLVPVPTAQSEPWPGYVEDPFHPSTQVWDCNAACADGEWYVSASDVLSPPIPTRPTTRTLVFVQGVTSNCNCAPDVVEWHGELNTAHVHRQEKSVTTTFSSTITQSVAIAAGWDVAFKVGAEADIATSVTLGLAATGTSSNAYTFQLRSEVVMKLRPCEKGGLRGEYFSADAGAKIVSGDLEWCLATADGVTSVTFCITNEKVVAESQGTGGSQSLMTTSYLAGCGDECAGLGINPCAASKETVKDRTPDPTDDGS